MKAQKRSVSFPLIKSSGSEEPIFLNGKIIHLIQEIEDIEKYEASGGKAVEGWRKVIEKKIKAEQAKIRKSIEKRSGKREGREFPGG